MSPVWIMSAGLSGIAMTLSIATLSVARASGLAGFSKPMWLSEIWTKEKRPSAALAAPMRREAGTPPATVQTTPVPAHSMHFKVWRRLKPSSCWSVIISLLVRQMAPFMEETQGRGGLFPLGGKNFFLATNLGPQGRRGAAHE